MYNVSWKNHAKNVDKLIVTERKLVVGLSATVGNAKKREIDKAITDVKPI